MAEVEKAPLEADQKGPRKFTFPAHKSHLLTLARLCQENKDFTDCLIQCDKDGEDGLRAHRMILGSASPFLKALFSDLPPSLHEATILVPGVKRRVVSALLDFLYTGEMTVDRCDTADLQRLIETLQINPELISVDIIDANVSKDGKVVDDDEEEDEESKAGESQDNVEDVVDAVADKDDDKAEVDSSSKPDARKRKLSTDSDDDDDTNEKKSKC